MSVNWRMCTKRTELTRWQGRTKIRSSNKWRKNSHRGCGANTVWIVAWKCRCCKKWEERLKSSPTRSTITVIWKEQAIQEVVTVSNARPLLAIHIFAYCIVISCYKMLVIRAPLSHIYGNTSLWTMKETPSFQECDNVQVVCNSCDNQATWIM